MHFGSDDSRAQNPTRLNCGGVIVDGKLTTCLIVVRQPLHLLWAAGIHSIYTFRIRRANSEAAIIKTRTSHPSERRISVTREFLMTSGSAVAFESATILTWQLLG